MIGKLHGTLEEVLGNHIIINVAGVGYSVYVNQNSITDYKINDSISFYIFTNVREDEISLYGFKTYQEKQYFEILRGVQGVGNKLAMSIIGSIPLYELYIAIINEDYSKFHKISGIGKKIAERIINELKNKKLPNVSAVDGTACELPNYKEEVRSALYALGFARGEVDNVLTSVVKDIGKEAKLESVLELCLKRIRS